MKLTTAGIGIILVLFLVTAPFAFATPVPIYNHSFEETAGTLRPNYWEGPWTFGAIPGWTYAGPSGVYGAWEPIPGVARYHDEVPDGAWIGYLNDGSLEQVLEWPIVLGSTYHLSIDIGNRLGFAFPEYEVSLFAGGTTIASSSVDVQDGRFTPLTIVHNVTDSDAALLNEALGIRISVTGGVGQVNFDNVRLTNDTLTQPLPEPSSMILLGLGLTALAGYCRKRFKR